MTAIKFAYSKVAPSGCSLNSQGVTTTDGPACFI